MGPLGDLDSLLASRRVVVSVGSGGVGKTTLAAALALRAAHGGKRVICLTIDPARRLAGSFGLSTFPVEASPVASEFLRSHGVRLQGELTVMMLDAKRTFDELVERHAKGPEQAARILSSRLYRRVSDNLAGVRSFMAMEKVLALLDDARFDLVVLDTPPSARSLDFFDAPTRMVEALDSPLTGALVRAVDGGGGIGRMLVARGVRRGISALSTVTGTNLLTEVAELLSSMNALFGGFSKRATEVRARMRSREFGYVLVTAPSTPQLLDARSLGEELARREVPIDAVVVNRIAPEIRPLPTPEELRQSPAFRSLGLSVGAEERILEAASRLVNRRRLEEQRVQASGLFEGVPRLFVPDHYDDIHRPDRLLRIFD